MALTADQIESYERDGYVVVKDALTGAEMAELRAAADFFAEQALHLKADSDVIELGRRSAPGGWPAADPPPQEPAHQSRGVREGSRPSRCAGHRRGPHRVRHPLDPHEAERQTPGRLRACRVAHRLGLLPAHERIRPRTRHCHRSVHRSERVHAGCAGLAHRSRSRSQSERPLHRGGAGGERSTPPMSWRSK